ncbi:MAG: hypothetical protein AAF580_12100 [Pseudomonadota bacterium]
MDRYVTDFGGIYAVYPETHYRGTSIKQFTNLREQHTRFLKRHRDVRLVRPMRPVDAG